MPHLQKFQQALALQIRGQWAPAQSLYEEIIRLQPDHFDALSALAAIAAQTGHPAEAAELIGRAMAADPNHPLTVFYRASVCHESGQWEAALAGYSRAIALQPDLADAHLKRGNVYYALERWDAALADYDAAIAIRADYVEAHANRAVALSELQQVDAAISSCDAAIALKEDHAEAHSNRGFLLQELRRWDEALASCNRAIAIKADYADAYFNRSIVRLLHGDFENGWVDYEWRSKHQGGTRDRDLRVFPQPRWLGDAPLAGKRILIYCEQGLGDTLQFCRYAKLLSDLGARVIMEVQAPLVALLAGLQGVSQILTKADPLPDFDYHCSLLSLPLAFKTDRHTIPAAPHYLQADARQVAHWREKLGERHKMRVGLMWSGSSSNKRDRYRSIRLTELLRHLPPQFQYVSLQKDVREIDRETLRSQPQIPHFGDEPQDFTDAAALCECMDLIISVDTSIAHLGGALGKETWIVLSSTPDWRWQLDRIDSPWYPTATLYRQEPAEAGWGGVLERLAADLLRKVT